MSSEAFKKAAEIYFTLLKEKSICDYHEYIAVFYEPDVRDAVLILADQSKTQIIEAPKRIQLVTKSNGSVFATNFSHLKEKHKEIENKKFFHLMSIISMSFLYMISKNEATKIQSKREGVTFYAIERSVNDLITHWENMLKEEPAFGTDKMIDTHHIVETWVNMEVENQDKTGVKRGNKRTRIGLIITAMKMLEDEKLIVVLDKDSIPKAFPKNELFERMEHLYHDQERFQEIKSLLESEEPTHA